MRSNGISERFGLKWADGRRRVEVSIMGQAIPTYVQQEIGRCMKAIKEAQKRLRDPETPILQQWNMKRRIEAQRKRMQALERRPV